MNYFALFILEQLENMLLISGSELKLGYVSTSREVDCSSLVFVLQITLLRHKSTLHCVCCACKYITFFLNVYHCMRTFGKL